MGFNPLKSIKKVASGGLKIVTGRPDQGFKEQADAFNFGGTSAVDIIPGLGDAKAAKKQNENAARQAELNRQFQERMSSTAYQRAMADMSLAGLNPTLAYMQGGASTPSGAVADVQSESASRLGDFAIQAATGVGNLRNQTSAVQSQNAVNEASVKLQAAQSAKTIAEAEKTRVETVKARKDIPRAELERDLSEKGATAIKKALNVWETSAKSIAPKGRVNPKSLKYEGPIESRWNDFKNLLKGKLK